METTPNLEAQIEALLFLYGEPVEIKKLASSLKTGEGNIVYALEQLREKLRAENRGLALILHDGRAQLTTKPELGNILAKAVEDDLDTGLTPASLETLAIVAYLGPVRRSLIEHIRGVNSSFILRSLMIRGLVERKPDPKRPSAYVYQVTFDFLRHIGLDSAAELPEFEKYKEFAALFTGQPSEKKEERNEPRETNSPEKDDDRS